MMQFKDPLLLLLIIPVIAFAIWVGRERHKRVGFIFPTLLGLSDTPSTLRLRAARGLIVLRTLTLILIVIALARPTRVLGKGAVRKEGIDIMLVLDASTSMLAEDFTIAGKRTNRVDVVKSVVRDFVRARPDDRIGLVAFGSVAVTVSPLTLDHDWLIANLERVKAGFLRDGTAVGTAIMLGLNRIKDSTAKSRILILLTDGINNAGRIAPLTAAEAAKAVGIKIYTIGAGSRGPVPYPFQDRTGNIIYQNILLDIDETTLERIASLTDGQYFRATDTASLKRIYQEIDRLEKVTFQEKGYEQQDERFTPFALAALFLIVLESILRSTILKTIP
jgi:Ca-activated chloride channel family protein